MTQKYETDLRLAIALDRHCRSDKVTAGEIVYAVQQLNRESRTLHRWAEEACNRPLSEGEHKREALARERAVRIAKVYRLEVEFPQDPRSGCGVIVRCGGSEFRLANARGE